MINSQFIILSKKIYVSHLSRPGDEVGLVSMRVTCEEVRVAQGCLGDGPCIFLALFELRFSVGSNRV